MPEVFPPVVDLSLPDAPAQIDRVCRDVGFFQVVEHGIEQSLTDSVFDVADRFFGLPLSAKLPWSSDSPEVERGYSAKGTEGLGYTLDLEQPPDLFEALTFGREVLPDDSAFHTTEHSFFAPNIWPTEPTELRSTMLAYWDAAQAVVHRITGLMATGLDLDPDYFEPFTDKAVEAVRINYFEGRPGDKAATNQFGIGPHTDYGIVTVLLTDQEPALQVYTDSGEWRYVTPVPGALVVNVGDLLSRWTNDRWRSTLHRVVPVLTTDNSVRRRRSVPFFHEGNFDALIECLPTCVSDDNPARYGPIRGGEHVHAKTMSGRLLEAAGAESTLGDRAQGLTT
ncbi:isopenicillin N synthase family oxygenase [Gordonia sp. HNM0687]|uniref:Isopenicillin N synthase family oxygenase n=1 Tax=Gordonia mangrovi TaxID=2665643 RepID=A0A6L7GLJ7_9ACTN|nr:isopenicillin N synthase family oxygenase [Gordonia mangrovi]MXP20121.1 isopenicillin N synthase family oxygenase [Gordonia mangrovi]UVF79269.1 isopenicillin N synthase family oxygenase [Gordonia mangrovi]